MGPLVESIAQIVEYNEISATTRMRDGVPNTFCMPSKCLSDNWMPFSLDICLLDIYKDPPKTAGVVSVPIRPATLRRPF